VPAPDYRYVRYLALAFEFSGTIGAAVVLGWWLDRRLGTGPYLALACIVVAVVGGLMRLVQTLRRFERLDRGPES
jgi:F0F1-type ATP synthase assembly protein I